ncbi:MAG: hypothetical protein F6J95_018520 [Leptolyngbya sp. SIO1E4]|nr:hypothetical protein [Leptolyngbya sp. SIO1E4]
MNPLRHLQSTQDLETVQEVVALLTASLERLFPGGRLVPARYYALLQELVSLAPSLPQPQQQQLLDTCDRITRNNEVEKSLKRISVLDKYKHMWNSAIATVSYLFRARWC